MATDTLDAAPLTAHRERDLVGLVFSVRPSALPADLGLLAARIALAWIFIYYGAGKLFGAFNGPGIHRTALYFSNTAHLHPGGFFAVLGGLLEFGGGLAMALGLLTRLAGLALFGDMVMAMITVTWATGINATNPPPGYQLNLALAVLALVVALLGAGRFSLDALVDRRLTHAASHRELGAVGPRRRAPQRCPRSRPGRTSVRCREPPPIRAQVIRIAANVVGAAGAAYFAYVTLDAYLRTHRPIGLLLFAEQMVVVIAYLVRRPARLVTQRMADWLLAFGGTFAPVLLRPDGLHPAWGLTCGLVLQFCGVALCLWSFLALGRSFGFAAADRGLVARGPYRIVRHPIYASYVVLLVGYLLQSLSLRNIGVAVLATSVQRRSDTRRRARARHQPRAHDLPMARPLEAPAGRLVIGRPAHSGR